MLHLPRVGGGVEQRRGQPPASRVVDVGRGDGGHSKLRSIRVPSESQFSRTRSAVWLTSPVAAAATISVVLAHRGAAGQRAEAQPFEPPEARHQPRQHLRQLGVGARLEQDTRGSRRRPSARRRRRSALSAAAKRSLAARIAVEILRPSASARPARRPARGSRRRSGTRPAPPAGPAAPPACTLRLGLHQPVLLEPADRLAHRRPAQPQPRAQLLIAQPLPGRKRPIDDRVAHRHIRPITQQIALERR